MTSCAAAFVFAAIGVQTAQARETPQCAPYQTLQDGECRGDAEKSSAALVELLSGLVPRGGADAYEQSDPKAVLASVLILLENGARPNAAGSEFTTPLGLAAVVGFPKVVSVLLTAGANPNSWGAGAGGPIFPGGALRWHNPPQIIFFSGRLPDARAVTVLRHYIGGLHAAGVSDYDWNSAVIAGPWPPAPIRPLDFAANTVYSQPGRVFSASARLDAAALIYERGGRCAESGNLSKPACRLPVETLNFPAPPDGHIGAVLTVFARDFGGDKFSLHLPDNAKLATLQSSGWTLSLENAPPMRITLSRARLARRTDAGAAFTITMRADDGADVREFRVSTTVTYNRAQTLVFVSSGRGRIRVVRPGVPEFAPVDGKAVVYEGEKVLFRVIPRLGHHVSIWASPPGVCDVSVGADAGERNCTHQIVPRVTPRALTVSVRFAPGRLPEGIPAVGNVPAGATQTQAERAAAAAEMARACRAFGGAVWDLTSLPNNFRADESIPACYGLHSPRDFCTYRGAVAGRADEGEFRCDATFNHYRDCNAVNRVVSDVGVCRATCSEGFVARGDECHIVGDQCAPPEAPSCPFGAFCVDSNLLTEESDAELCRCGGRRDGTTGGCWDAPANAALIALLSGSAEASAENVRELLRRGANPNAVDADGSAALALAAKNLHAAAVSVLLTAGADSKSRTSDASFEFTVPHHVAYHGGDPRALEVLRHFIAGLRTAGLADSFDGWNAPGSASGYGPAGVDQPPLFFLNALHGENPVSREIHSLLWEWGARCEFCGAPSEDFLFVVNNHAHVGPAFTITLRPPARTPLTLAPPSWHDDDLTANGWGLSVNTAAHPDEWIFSRVRRSRAGDAPSARLWTLPLLDGDGRTVRLYRVTAQMIVNDPRPLYYSAEGGGDLTAFSNGLGVANGITLRPGPRDNEFSAQGLTLLTGQRVTFRAVADIGHRIGGWTENCAGSPSGETTAEGECVLTMGEDDFSLVRAVFRAPRISVGLPLTGDIPGDAIADIRQYCELAGGRIVRKALYTPDLHPDVVWPANKATGEVCSFGAGLLCRASNSGAPPPGVNVGCSDGFPHVRDCNLQNRPALSFSECGAACPPGTWARGGACERAADQCALASAPSCGVLRQCVDPDHQRTDSDAELCACRPGENCGVDGGGEPHRTWLLLAVTTYFGPCRRCYDRDYMAYRALFDGAPPNTEDQAGAVLAQAALAGQAKVVSILITAGADPNGTLRRIDLHPGYGPSHHHPFWRNGTGGSPRNLHGVLHAFSEHLDSGNGRVTLAYDILRHFIGGMEVAGVLDEFDGWNALATVRTESDEAVSPLLAFSRRASRSASSDPLLNDIRNLLGAYGAKCLPDGDYRANPTAPAFEYCGRDTPELRALDSALLRLREAVRGNDAAETRAAYNALPSKNDLTDESGVPLLIVAATLGHGEVVSVLITLGADANTRHEGRAVPHVSALNAASLAAATVFSVIRHFAHAVSLSGARHAWNSKGGAERLSPIEQIALRRDEATDDDERAGYLKTADFLIAQGGRCSPSSKSAESPGVKYNPACVGSAGLSLALLAAMTTSRPTATEMEAAIQAVRDSGMDPLAVGHDVYGHLLPLAAMRGNAAAVSVLIALGHPPDSRARADMARSPSALHHIANQAAGRPDEMTAVFRAFIGGLRSAGLLYIFDNWNQLTDDLLDPKVEGGATAMDIILRRGAARGDLWRWLYEAGAACHPGAGTDAELCGKIPTQPRRTTAPDGAGRALIVRGTDFRGDRLHIPAENADALAALAAEGWATRIETTPGRFELLRTRGRRSSDSGAPAVFTVTALMEFDRRTARIWAARAQAPQFVTEQLADFAHAPSDGSGGTLSAAGFENSARVFVGARATFTARPLEGWRVERWEGTGGVQSCPRGTTEDAACVLTVPTDSDLLVTAFFARTRAVFFLPPISARRTDADGGAAAQSGELFDVGVTLVFSGNPPRDGRVLRWRRNGEFFPDCDNADECQMTVAAAGLQATVVYGASVHFSHSPSAGSGGTLRAAGVLNGDALPTGATVTFTAFPAEGWHAAEWGGDASGCAPSVRPEKAVCEVTVRAGIFATVTFAESRTVSILPPVSARRSDSDGGGAVENGQVFADGVTLMFSAERENFRVSGWRLNGELVDACADANPCALAADGDNLRMVAEYAPLPRTIYYGHSPDDGSGGTVTVSGLESGGTALYGSPVTFIASPADGWFAGEWLGDNGECQGRESLGAPSEAGDARNKFCVQSSRAGLSVAAVFAEIDAAVICDDEGLPAGCVPPDQCVAGSNPCDANAFCEDNDGMNRNPAWEICACDRRRGYDGDGRVCELLLPPLASVRFSHIPTDGGGGTLTVFGLENGGDAEHGTRVTFSALPADNWHVSGWRGDASNCPPSVRPGRADCEVMVNSDLFAAAVFSESRTVSISAPVSARRTQADGGGEARNGDVVADGATITFFTGLMENHRLIGWRQNNTAVAECDSATVCARVADGENLHMLAVFDPLPRTVYYDQLPADGSGGKATVAGLESGGTLPHGAPMTIVAAPRTGWFVRDWLGEDGACRNRAGLASPVTESGVEKMCVLPAREGLAVTAVFERWRAPLGENKQIIDAAHIRHFCERGDSWPDGHNYQLARFHNVSRSVRATSHLSSSGREWENHVGAHCQVGISPVDRHADILIFVAQKHCYALDADKVERYDPATGEFEMTEARYNPPFTFTHTRGLYEPVPGNPPDYPPAPGNPQHPLVDAWRPAPEPTHCDLVLACAQPGMADLDGNYFTEDDCIVENQCLRDDNPCDANASCVDPDFANENPAWEICECNRADGYVGDGASCELPGPAQSVVDHAHLPAEGGTLTARGVQDGLADEGARVTFAATPAEKYYVSGWTGAGCAADGETGQARSPGAAKECEMLVGEANVFVTVNFAAAREVVFGGALASLGGASIRSGAHVEDGATITFHAEIPENNRVSGWTNNGATVGLCGDNRMCEVAADDDVNVLARFSPVQRLVDYSHSPGIGGTLRAHVIGGGTVDHGTTVTFTAIPAEGYDVSGWSDSECGAVGLARTPGIEKECELIAESDVYVTVTFAIARKVEFGGALASLGGESIDSGAYAADGATITFYAEIPENHEVSEWTNNGAAVESCGGNRICEVAADDDVNVLARFSPVQRLVDYSHSPGAGGTLRALVIGGGTVDHGTTVTFTAIPADDFYVHSWTGSGAECSGGQCVLTATMALLVTVHFGRDQCASAECGDNMECRDENHLTADASTDICSCAPNYALIDGACVASQYAVSRPSAAVFENGIVSLSWTAPAEPVSGYVILRQTVASGIYASLTVAADLSHVDENAPPGATVRYKIQAEVAGVDTPESEESLALTVPPAADCRAMNRAPGSRPQFCDRGCMTLEGARFMQLEPGGACLHWLRDDFGGMPQADVCLALRRKNDQILEGAEKRVCSGIDKIDTFCILDSTDAFPCRGLFKHVLQCNLEHNRPAEDMFFCGPKCPPGQNAVGAECRE